MFEVYIIHSKTLNKFYIGQTKKFESRLIRHNKGLVKSTKNGIPWNLITKIAVDSRSEALILEKKIKGRGAKRYLLDNKINFGM